MTEYGTFCFFFVLCYLELLTAVIDCVLEKIPVLHAVNPVLITLLSSSDCTVGKILISLSSVVKNLLGFCSNHLRSYTHHSRYRWHLSIQMEWWKGYARCLVH